MGSSFDQTDNLLWGIASLLAAIEPEKWVTVKRAAGLTGLTDNYIHKLIAAGRVASKPCGRRLNVLLKDVLDAQLGDPKVKAKKPNTTGLLKGKEARR